MEEQIKKIYEKQKNGRIRMIRNVLLIYAALICEAAGLGHDRSQASVDLRGG